MREMNLTDIQNVSIEILGVIDEFCTKNDIMYSLGYGALIGAIRHKGFIPWDDDIDIIMDRANYTKFISLFNDYKGYRLYAPELHNCYHAISRVCEMKNTLVWKYYKWNNETNGVWVDIFPYDYIPTRDGGTSIRNAADLCYAACKAHIGFSRNFGILQNLSNLKEFIKHGYLCRERAIKKYLNELNQQDEYSKDTIRNYASPYGLKDVHSSQIFDNYTRAIFDNLNISIITNYDVYLKKIYSDYMTPPPLDQQIRGHSLNKFYWI